MHWRRKWHPTPVFLPGKSHGQRSLVGCSPWGREESDTTEQFHFHFSLSCIGEGSGNPLQCSCLENPRDGGAWWAAIDGVAHSRTRLKRLSSSSSVLKATDDFLRLFVPLELSRVLYLPCVCLCVCVHMSSRVQFFVTPWAVAHHIPLSLEVSRQEYWLLFSPQSCLTLCDPMDCSTPGFPVLPRLLEFSQIHVY